MSRSEPSKASIDALLHLLTQRERLRVWSVIVTFFGDCVVPRGGQIALGSLLDVMALFQFEGNAVRTALSRLVKDGYLEREKYGRHTSYRLAKDGNALFAKASDTIYASGPVHWQGAFDLVLITSGSNAPSAGTEFEARFRREGFGSPIPGVYMRPATGGAISDEISKLGFVQLKATSMADHSLKSLVQAAWPLATLNMEYQRLIECFSTMDERSLTRLSDQDSLGLRVLLIHEWRRLVLKDVNLPPEHKAENWQGEVARQLVARVYHSICEPSERALDLLEANPNTKLPTPKADPAQRFTS